MAIRLVIGDGVKSAVVDGKAMQLKLGEKVAKAKSIVITDGADKVTIVELETSNNGGETVLHAKDADCLDQNGVKHDLSVHNDDCCVDLSHAVVKVVDGSKREISNCLQLTSLAKRDGLQLVKLNVQTGLFVPPCVEDGISGAALLQNNVIGVTHARDGKGDGVMPINECVTIAIDNLTAINLCTAHDVVLKGHKAPRIDGSSGEGCTVMSLDSIVKVMAGEMSKVDVAVTGAGDAIEGSFVRVGEGQICVPVASLLEPDVPHKNHADS